MNSKSTLVLALLAAASMAGCLVSESDDPIDEDTKPAVAAGTILGQVTFTRGDDILVGFSTPDGTAFMCAEETANSASYQWQLPTHFEDIPSKYGDVRIELEALTPSALDLDLYVYDSDGNLLGSNTEFDVTDGPPQVVLGSRPPGDLTIIVRSCLGAASAFSVAGTATAVAAMNVFDDPIEVYQKGDQWYAVKTLEFEIESSNSVALGQATTGAGFIDARAYGGDVYVLVAELTGRGNTEQQARDRLKQIQLNHNSADAATNFVLDVTARTENGNWNGQQADLAFSFPSSFEWTNLDLRSTAGAIFAHGLDTQALDVSTSAGAIEVMQTRANNMVLDTSAGAVTAQMRESTASGSWRIEASAGALDLRLIEGNSYGYDVEASTTAGQVTFNFQDAPTTETDCQYASCYKHAVTNGFSGRAIQVEVDMETSAGFISARS